MNVRRSVLLSLLERHTGIAIQFASNIVIARLLTPAEIGLYSVCAALLALVYVIREFGITAFLIQDRNLTEAKIRTAFGLMILMSWPLAVATWFGRSLVASIYGYPEISAIIGILAVNFLILPFGQPARGLLNRDMRFQALTLIDVTSAGLHALTAIGFSWSGHGPMSLAYASVVGTATTVLMTLCYEPRHVRLLPALTSWKEMLGFGTYSTAASVVGTIGTNAAEIVIGKVLDLTSVGLYSRATGLVRLLQSQLPAGLSRVALPGFAQMLRAGERLEQPYLSAVSHLTGFLWPAYAFLALVSEPLIGFLFGDKWLGAVPVARILCIGGALNAIIFLVHSVYGAHGAVKRRLVAESIVQSVRLVLIIVAAPFGLAAVAGVQVLTTAAAGIVYYAAVRRYLQIGCWEMVRAVWRSAAVAAVTALSVIGAWLLADPSSTAFGTRLSLALAAGALGWWLGLSLLRHILGQEIWRAVETMFGRICLWARQ